MLQDSRSPFQGYTYTSHKQLTEEALFVNCHPCRGGLSFDAAAFKFPSPGAPIYNSNEFNGPLSQT